MRPSAYMLIGLGFFVVEKIKIMPPLSPLATGLAELGTFFGLAVFAGLYASGVVSVQPLLQTLLKKSEPPVSPYKASQYQ